MISHLVCYDSITAVFTLGLTVFNSRVLRQYALKKIECIQPQHNGQKIYIFPSPMLFYDVIFKILFNCALSLWLQSF